MEQWSEDIKITSACRALVLFVLLVVIGEMEFEILGIGGM